MDDKHLECKILLVDDMEMNLIILSEIIKSMGHIPLTATSAKDALEILKNNLPQLILLDVSMPDMSGLEFCKLLKEDVYTREIPVIFISAMDSQDDLSKAFEAGAVDYIFKPFDPNDVVVRVSTHLKIYTMQKELEDANRELNRVIKQQMNLNRESQKNMYKLMSEMVASRDSSISHICGSEAHMVRILTQAMQFSPDFENDITESFIAEIEAGALLHDIGMIAVPDSIVLKEGPLTDAEMYIVKKHVTYVDDKMNVICKSEDEKLQLLGGVIQDVIKYHHERFDGSGYPYGLKANEIPLAARIMGVIDTYDALINKRCYKDPYPFETAMQHMEEGAGTLYDPKIISILKKIQRQFEKSRRL